MNDPFSHINQAISTFNPYNQAGQEALHGYKSNTDWILAHPTALEDKILKGYSLSPYAQYQTNALTKHMNRAAALAGNLGTPNEQSALGRETQKIVSADEQQYLRNAMQPYETAYQGEGNIAHMGLSAADRIAQEQSEAARLAEQQKEHKEDSSSGFWGSVLGAGTSILGDIIPFL